MLKTSRRLTLRLPLLLPAMLLFTFMFALNAGAELKEMETDRPDKTESSVTVDRGHAQLEFEVASFTHSRRNSDQFSVGAFEARYGVSNRCDLQVQFAPYVNQIPGGGRPDGNDGVGDTTLRVKVSLSGDEAGATGLAVMPFVKVPTAREGNGKVEGGVVIPMKVMLPADTELSFEVAAAAVRTDANDDETAQFISSYSLGHKLGCEKLHGYLEFYSQSSPRSDWIATVDTGVTLQLDKNNQFDAGINIGASIAADPWNPFLGYSVRF